MADFGIYTKNADIVARAGVNANSTSSAVAATDVYVLDIEAFVNSWTRFNWSDLVTAGINVDVQGILTDTSASLCAMNVINDDMSGFPTIEEGQTKLDVLNNTVQRNLSALKDIKVQTFMIGA